MIYVPHPDADAEPRPDHAPYCPRCAGLAPRASAAILLARAGARVVNVEVQVFYCAACDLPLVETTYDTAPLAPTTGPPGAPAQAAAS